MKKALIFASGSGSNAEKIVQYFEKHPTIKIMEIWTNNPLAKVLERAKKLSIPTKVFKKQDMEQENFLKELQKKTDYIILAGFLLKIPKKITQTFQKKIINMHPSLLPKYGGKGMHGKNVHKAIKENKETKTGITIHFVNENYDEGKIIFQEKIRIHPKDSIEKIAEKVQILEHKFFAKAIEKIISKNIQ